MINDRKQLGRRIVKDESLFSNMGFGGLPSPLSGLPRMEVRAPSGLGKILKAGFIVWLVQLVILLAVFVTAICIVWHFVAKYW